MEITNAKFTATGSIVAMVDAVEMYIPAVEGNRHYDELVAQGIEPEPYEQAEALGDQIFAQSV